MTVDFKLFRIDLVKGSKEYHIHETRPIIFYGHDSLGSFKVGSYIWTVLQYKPSHNRMCMNPWYCLVYIAMPSFIYCI